MDFRDVICGRESVRSYDPNKPVDKLVLERILEAGRVAPSAANRQPWRFVLVSSRENLLKLKRCYARPWFQDAPHILVVVGKVGDAWTRQDGYNSIETDLAIAMDHMILAAENEGVATCCIAAYDPGILRSALGLGPDERVYTITTLGYPRSGYTKKIRKERKQLAEVVTYL
ncbi:MAG TPA: nitroreductase family protein [Spirochaetia bacterium]|nr:nitroreductase family protein [Spirochaetia bacterium]